MIEDETVTEIMVNGPDSIFVERKGKLTRWPKSFTDQEKLEDVIQQIVGKCNRIVNESSPIVDARLENGARVNVVVAPVALNGPIPVSYTHLHTNGIYGVQAAVEAGVDSVEHGNYIDPETIRELADSDSVWVPTLVTIRNLRGCGRYKESVLDPIIELAAKNLRLAYKYRAKVALGSDAGAYMVLHGKGLMDEYQAFMDILGESGDVRAWLADGEKRIQDTFRRPES